MPITQSEIMEFVVSYIWGKNQAAFKISQSVENIWVILVVEAAKNCHSSQNKSVPQSEIQRLETELKNWKKLRGEKK